MKGLRAPGNLTVDIEWKDGKVTHYRIASPELREVRLRVNGKTKAIRSKRLYGRLLYEKNTLIRHAVDDAGCS